MVSNERSRTDKFVDLGAAESCGSLFNAFVSHFFLDSLDYVLDNPFGTTWPIGNGGASAPKLTKNVE